MMSRLQNDLNDFQLQYSICGLDMFNDWIQDTIGFLSKKCYLGSSYNTKDNDIYYSAEDVSLSDLHKILTAFHIPEENYRTGQTFDLSQTLIFDELLPAYKLAVAKMAIEQPLTLKPYQIESKPELEKEAIRKIETAARTLIKELTKQSELSHSSKALLKIALCVKAVLQEKSEKMESLIRLMKESLTEHLEAYPPVAEDILSSTTTALLNGFNTYEALNQVELRRITAKLLPEVEAFSRLYNISETKCDFFEEMLMRIAGITQMPTHSNISHVYSDKTRFEIRVDNLQEQDVARFLQLFKEFGDETAFTGKKRKRHQAKAMLETAQCASIKIPNAFHDKTDQFNVDGVVLYQNIFPQFKAFVTELAAKDPSVLVKYQEASRALIAAEKKANNDASMQNPSTLFQPANLNGDPVPKDVVFHRLG